MYRENERENSYSTIYGNDKKSRVDRGSNFKKLQPTLLSTKPRARSSSCFICFERWNLNNCECKM